MQKESMAFGECDLSVGDARCYGVWSSQETERGNRFDL